MKRLMTIVVLAFSLIPNTLTGAELGPEPHKAKNKNTDKIIAFMAHAGLGNEDFKKAAYYVDEHVDDGFYHIHQGKYAGVTMQLNYEMKMPSADKFQVKFTHEDAPSWTMTGSTRGVMVNYHIDFE